MSNKPLYARLKRRFAFMVPESYQQMHARGWFTLDRPAADISTVPGDGYLWLHDMEWYSLAEIAAFKFPSHYAPHLPHLVPFAFSGSGDYWCWQTDHTDLQGTRVLFCPHDYQLATIYAPSFGAALYRQALEYSSGWLADDPGRLIEGRAYLRRWSIDLALAMPAAWSQVLAETAERQAVEWSDRRGSHTSLISPVELAAILARDLQCDQLDSELPWMALDEA